MLQDGVKLKRKVGRPPGHSKFGAPTKPIRIPELMIPQVLSYITANCYKLPLYSSKISAGFPSPADDFIEGELDLNELLIKRPAATFYVRATGESMINAGIYPNDILIVDRSLPPSNGKIVIAAIDGELTVKRFYKSMDEKLYLLPENPDYAPIEIQEGSEVYVWGVVTNVIHAV